MPRGDRSLRAASQRGRDAEVELAQLLETEGWVVGSRRHIGGAGDLLAVRSWAMENRLHEVWLIEVKDRKSVWQGFRREDRVALVETAAKIGAQPKLAWRIPGDDEWVWLDPEQWPRVTA